MQFQAENTIGTIIIGSSIFLFLVLAFLGSLIINNRRLRKEWDFISSIFDTTAALIVAIDSAGKITQFNKACEIITGMLSSEIIGKDYKQIELVPAELVDIRPSNNFSVTAQVSPIIESTYKTAAGYNIIITWSRTNVSGNDERINTVICTGVDITKQKLVEDKFKRSEEQLRALAMYIQSVREEERTNVAREIHDDLGQALTAIKMDISWLEKNLSAELNVINEKFESLLTLVNQTIKTVKKIATELRPGILDDLGIASAIEWQAEEFQKRTNILCKLNIFPEYLTVDEKISVHLFRIFQETLTNIMRHAQAKNVEISLIKSHNELNLQVSDDGKGINRDEINSNASLGLLGIRERIRQLNGTVTFEGNPDNGTKVNVTIPLIISDNNENINS